MGGRVATCLIAPRFAPITACPLRNVCCTRLVISRPVTTAAATAATPAGYCDDTLGLCYCGRDSKYRHIPPPPGSPPGTPPIQRGRPMTNPCQPASVRGVATGLGVKGVHGVWWRQHVACSVVKTLSPVFHNAHYLSSVPHARSDAPDIKMPACFVHCSTSAMGAGGAGREGAAHRLGPHTFY